MNQPADLTREQAIEIRFGQVGLVQVRLHTTDPGAILDELTGRTATAPHFFERTAVALDLSGLRGEPALAEIRGVIDVVRRAGMLTVGLTQGSESTESLARQLDMPLMTPIRVPSRPVPVVQAAPQPDPAPPALMQYQPVRSGQRIYARDRDLIVLATVAAGAEAMADGCVHVYGSLRGRVMAGVHGDTSARVFCQEFRAELVSIAGVFRVFETIPAELAGHPVQSWLDGETLRFARLGT
ncbi:MAG TPA: septum site-determining protein MinC [Steroidobacteraceae bacterium]|nr:septum site-determining protein MinC [Steroidobacteraceae bacterium]